MNPPDLPNPMKPRAVPLAVSVWLTLAATPPGHADVISDWNRIGDNYLVQYAANQEERGLAMMHLAQFEAVNAVVGGYTPYALNLAAPDASPEAAAVQAAYTVLTNLNRANLSVLSTALRNSLATVPDGPAKEDGIQLGRLAADTLIQLRAADNLDLVVPAPSSTAIGRWRPTPPRFTAGVSAELRYLTPFTMTTIAQFRQGPPPAWTSEQYAADYNEVRLIGGRGSTARTADQTEAAWFYESLGYTDIWDAVLPRRPLSLVESARLFALAHLAISDARASVCATKYAYGFWRPVTAIQNGEKDGNDATPGDPTWTSFFDTHAHPDYPSQASQVVGALVEVLLTVYGDDFNLEVATPALSQPRRFARLSALFDDVVVGRVAAGMHFRNSCVVAVETGRQIGRHAVESFLRPVGRLAADRTPAAGSFRLSLEPGPARSYVIQTSRDLVEWQPWQTNTYGVIQFTDPDGLAGSRFYRLQEWR